MNTQFVKEIAIISFCLHPEKPYIYYLYYSNIAINIIFIVLDHNSKSLAINEEDTISSCILNIYDVPKDDTNNKETSGYHLTFYKKKNFLVLAYPSAYISVWDTITHINLLKTATKGKDNYIINCMVFSEHNPILFFSAMDKRNLYAININDAILNSTLNYKKMRVPKKLTINDIKCHPFETYVLIACSDGYIRIWDQISFHHLISISENISPNKRNTTIVYPGITCLSFSNDGQKLLSSDETGKIFCWDSKNLGQRAILIASIRVSEIGLISVGWLNYHGEQNSNRILCYTGEGYIKSISLKMNSNYNARGNNNLGKFSDVEKIYKLENEIHSSNLKNLQLGLSKYLQIHNNNNFICFINRKINILNIPNLSGNQSGNIQLALNLKIVTIFDKLYPTFEYPIFSPSAAYKFEDYIPNNEKNLYFQKYTYFLDDMEIKSFSLGDGSIKTLKNLKTLITAEDIKFYKMDFRPLRIEPNETGQILLIYHMEHSFRAILIPLSIEESHKDVEVFKEYPCSFSFFLGEMHLKYPPLYLLSEDRLNYSIIFNEESNLDNELKNILSENGPMPIEGTLKIKIEKVFRTPLRKGFVILYQIYGENTIRFSNNKLLENDILDFNVLNNTYSFRLEYDETILDIVWQNESIYMPDHLYGAAICPNIIYFIDSNLTIIKNIKIGNISMGINPILHSFFVGFTLLVANKTNIMYVTFNHNAVPVLTFENIDHKNNVMMVLVDRMIIASKKRFDFNPKHKGKQQNLEIKCRKFNVMEILVMGYLGLHAVKKDFVVDRNLIKKILSNYENSQISNALINELNKYNMHQASWFLTKNENNVHLFSLEKINNVLNGNSYDDYLEQIFNNNFKEDDLALKELIQNLQNNPNYAHIHKKLQEDLQIFINLGYYKNAANILFLISNDLDLMKFMYAIKSPEEFESFISIIRKSKNFNNCNPQLQYILNSVSHDKSIQYSSFEKRIITSVGDIEINNIFDKLSTINDYKIDKNEELMTELFYQHNILNNYQTNLFDEHFKTIELGFGEQKYHQNYYIKEGQSKKIDLLSSENPSQFLGYNSLIPEDIDKQHQEKDKEDAFGANFHDNEESDKFINLLIYWRFEKGKGLIVDDIGNFEINGGINIRGERDNDEIWNVLDDGDPMELEDNYGNKCPIQYAINLYKDEITIKSIAKPWNIDSLKQFTLEFWLKPRIKNGLILDICNGSFLCHLQNLLIKIIVKNKEINMLEDDKKDDGNNEHKNEYQEDEFTTNSKSRNKDESKQIKENFWNHIAIAYNNNSDKNLIIYLNCIEIAYSKFILPTDLFKDSIISIGKDELIGEITEFRFWKTSIDISDIKQNYRTPLEIVNEKKKKIDVKFRKKEEGKKNDHENFLKEFKFAEDFSAIDSKEKEKEKEKEAKLPVLSSKLTSKDDESTKSFDFASFSAKPPSNFENFDVQQSNFAFQEPQKEKWGNFETNDFPSNKNLQNFEKNDLNSFKGFGDWGSVNTGIKKENSLGFDFPKNDSFNNEQNNQINEFTKEKNNNNLKNNQIKQDNNLNFEKKNSIEANNPQNIYNEAFFDNLCQDIITKIDKASNFMKEGDLNNSIVEIQKSFSHLKTLFVNYPSAEKYGKIQKYATYCAIYRFFFQILIGIHDMNKMKDIKKESFLYLILVNLNIKPEDRISFIIKTIEKNVEAKNFGVCDSILTGLKPNLEKIKINNDQIKKIKDLSILISNSEKQNENLLKMFCPTCKKAFHFKANKKCPKCNSNFLLCSQTLICLKSEEALICNLCQSIFSLSVKKEGEGCIICRIGTLKKNL